MQPRIVIVTGGSSGIGFATARKFLEQGDTVVILSTNEAKGRAAESKLKAYGEVCWMSCNAARNEDCVRVAQEVEARYGRIDVLVNNAGIVSKRVPFLQVELEDVRHTLDVNVMGTIQMIRAVSDVMVRQGKGVVVNIGSICGTLANTESVGYHASKGAVAMVTKSLARELTPYGIRVVSAAPGWVRTDLIDDAVAQVGGTLHMKGRIIEPEEIAGAVWLLSLDEASAINGSTVMVDDGYASFKGLDGGVKN